MAAMRRVNMLRQQVCAASSEASPSLYQFTGALDMASLAHSPLEEMRARSEAKGLCDAQGGRCKGAPWGFQLAHAAADGSPFPVVRTIGFQRVMSEHFSFLMRRRPGAIISDGLPVSATYVEGKYTAGDVCEQWRLEGIAREAPISEVLATAPMASFAQILVAGGGQSASGQAGARGRLEARDVFISKTNDMKAKLTAGEVSEAQIAEAVVVYRVKPIRVEFLIGGPDFPMWERVEWKRASEAEPWAAPVRLLPY